LHGAESSLQVTFSCGLAGFNGQSASDLIEQADQALYQAKKAGRNCVKSA